MSTSDHAEPKAATKGAVDEPTAAPVDRLPTAERDTGPAPEPSAADEALAAVEPPAPVEPPSEAEPVAPLEPSVPAEPEAADIVLEALARIEDRLSESQRLIDRQADIAARLHAENQVLRGGELRRAQSALVLSVLRVYDDVSQMAATTEEPAGRNDLAIVADALKDALARNGIDAVAVQAGEPFEARRHKVATVVATADPAADRTVASVVRPGFVWSDGDAVRVSDVAVFKFVAPSEQEVAAGEEAHVCAAAGAPPPDGAPPPAVPPEQ